MHLMVRILVLDCYQLKQPEAVTNFLQNTSFAGLKRLEWFVVLKTMMNVQKGLKCLNAFYTDNRGRSMVMLGVEELTVKKLAPHVKFC